MASGRFLLKMVDKKTAGHHCPVAVTLESPVTVLDFWVSSGRITCGISKQGGEKWIVGYRRPTRHLHISKAHYGLLFSKASYSFEEASCLFSPSLCHASFESHEVASLPSMEPDDRLCVRCPGGLSELCGLRERGDDEIRSDLLRLHILREFLQ